MIKPLRLVLAVAVLCGLASPFEAGARSLRGPLPDDWLAAPEGVQPGLRAADGRPCVKQCPDDTLPCDPPAFKQADGRCTTQWH